jgi:hypothetical protein
MEAAGGAARHRKGRGRRSLQPRSDLASTPPEVGRRRLLHSGEPARRALRAAGKTVARRRTQDQCGEAREFISAH